MRKKKLLTTAMALVTVFAMTIGCAGCGNADNTQSNNSNVTQDTSAKNGEKITIEYWHCNAQEQGGAAVEELVSKFNEENDHIEVVAKYNPDMYAGLMKNLQAEVAVGNTPAVVQIGWSYLEYFSNNFEYLAPQDAIDKYDAEMEYYENDNICTRRLSFFDIEKENIYGRKNDN